MKYKLRLVVNVFEQAKYVLGCITRWEFLECGHAVRYRYPQSKSEAIRQLGKIKRRCYECGKQ